MWQAKRDCTRAPLLAGIIMVAFPLAGSAEPASVLKHPDWHPGGEKLIVEGTCDGDADLYTVDLRTGLVHRSWNGQQSEGYPRWFPDGEKVAFHEIDDSRKSRIVTANVSENSEYQLSDPVAVTDGPFDIEPAPSPDGTSIAFTMKGPESLDIAILDLGSGEVTTVTETQAYENLASWHPDGDRLIFHSDQSGIKELWQSHLPDGTVAIVDVGPGTSFAGHYGPDGRTLVFNAELDGNREIYLWNERSLERKRLTQRPGRDGYPRLSPDGNSVAYHAEIEPGHVVIRVMALDSGQIAEYSCDSAAGPGALPRGK